MSILRKEAESESPAEAEAEDRVAPEPEPELRSVRKVRASAPEAPKVKPQWSRDPETGRMVLIKG